MDIVLSVFVVAVIWRILCVQYQRGRIALLGSHLSGLQLERHMETLTQGYTRAISADTESRQLQVLETFAQTEHAVAAQVRTLADSMQKEGEQAAGMGVLRACVPHIERFRPALTRDLRRLLQIHADGLRHVVDNEKNLEPKDRAFCLLAELYLFQHSCHWYCKSRGVADARLMLRHKVDYQKVLDSVSDVTRPAYLKWLGG
ncbi:hypothetical protein EKL30_05495 [Candidimonas sp. SYP-B2681]|uniref:hypothetical protein n=1 Tax=Candidimonas sp. SYP-B2681 TaxID=2497686 RepID=UPI000F887C82|nr:hypothetical protein EKL30_05495 [Candidimonas sp. SYP-B2681]